MRVEIQAKTHVPTPVAVRVSIRSDKQREILRETQRPLGAGNPKLQILNPKARGAREITEPKPGTLAREFVRWQLAVSDRCWRFSFLAASWLSISGFGRDSSA